jgi:hypothetical protein
MKSNISCAYKRFELRIVDTSATLVSAGGSYTTHCFINKNINEVVRRLGERYSFVNHSFSLEQDFVIERYKTNWWMYEYKEYSNES